MKISILQTDIIWNDADANRRRAEAAIRTAAQSDVYVLPEMFTSGFCVNPANVAEDFDASDESLSPTLRWMKGLAGELDCAVAGSVMVKERVAVSGADSGEQSYRYFNRLFFVYPDGTYRYYDKRHLFTYGEENRHYTHGEERVVVKFRGVRILLQICYDLRFPVWSRNKGDYDMVLYVASWPTSRISVWDTLLRARALENQCYVAGVNRVGTDPTCEYSGGSCIIDPYGKAVAECPEGAEGAATAMIDMDRLEAFRRKFPVLADRDDFQIV